MSGKIWLSVLLVLSLWTMACFNPRGSSPPVGASGESSGNGPDDPSGDPGATEPTTGVTSGTGSSGEPETGSTGSTGFAPFCGDGGVDPPEECDDGLANADDAGCTLMCKKAACGDGLVWAGVEECDDGPENGDGYGKCAPSCQLNAHCGDGVVEPGVEICDNAELNGSGVRVDGMAPCGFGCTWSGRVAFVSSETYTGDFNGLDYTDYACQALAEASGLARSDGFRAWISAGFDSPLNRFELIDHLPGAPYILLDGRVIAEDFTELVEDGPRTGISITEQGDEVFDQFVWTNTAPDGSPYSMTNHCAAWTSMDPANFARRGFNALPVELGPAFQLWRSERHWTSYESKICSATARLFCFQDAVGQGVI